METINKQSLTEYLDALVAEGKEIKMCWEGGCDEGSVFFEIDEQRVTYFDYNLQNDPTGYFKKLVDKMYDELDYGSWAGDFSADGEAIYNSEQKAFVGMDYYSENDETVNYDCALTISIPKDLWFDRMEIMIENEEADVNSAFHVRNGFLTEKHEVFIEQFNAEFHKQVWAVIQKFMNDQKQNEYRSIWENYDLNRSEFIEEGDYMICNLENLEIGIEKSIEKCIYLNIENINVEDDEK